MSRIILYDLETSRTQVEGYGNRWDFKVVKFTKQSELMCYSWKELGEKHVHFVSRYDFKTYHDFVQSLQTLLDSADITIAHNGGSFDDKMSNRFFVTEGILPPKPRKTVDTKREAKRWFRFDSNSLDDLGYFLGLGRKESIGYANLEDDYMSGNPSKKTVKLLKKYNDQDVNLLEAIYLRMLPFMSSHPNLGDITQRDGICPKCGSDNLHKRGFNHKRNGTTQRYQCQSCYGWCSEASIKKKGRVVNGV
jgi:hypothetical protein